MDLLRKAARAAVARGRKLTEFSGANTASDAAVAAMLGTTGNLRAPTLVTGDTLLVGFNEALYAEVFGQ